MKIAIYTLFASLLISMTSCLEETSSDRLDIQQTISYVEDSWEYRDVEIVWCGDRPMTDYNTFTGYVLITKSPDFSFTDKGSYEFIDSMKCVRLIEIKELQISMDKLRDKTCESDE